MTIPVASTVGQYIQGNYEEAESVFTTAIADYPQTEILYIYAGNSVIRQAEQWVYQMENSFDGLADVSRFLEYTEHALTFYNQSIEIKDNYSIGLLGRGIVIFRIAQAYPFAYDPSLVLRNDQTCIKHDLPE